MLTVKYFSFQKWYNKSELYFLSDNKSSRVTRDVLVLGHGLMLKPTIALRHGGIFVNSYSDRDSPAIPHPPWYAI